MAEPNETPAATVATRGRRWAGALLLAAWYFPGGLLAAIAIPRTNNESVFDAPLGIVVLGAWYGIWVALLGMLLARSASISAPSADIRHSAPRLRLPAATLLVLAGAVALVIAQ